MAKRSRGGEGETELSFELSFDMAPVPRAPGKKKVPPSVSPAPQAEAVASSQLLAANSQRPTPNSEIPSVLTVSQLTRRISDLLEDDIGSVWVEGEISNLRIQSSGHHYFTLKDASSQLSCVLFARMASSLGIPLRDGLQVQLHGKIGVYEPRGQYQLVVSLVQEKGVGILRARFEELKQRLAAEGLFEPAAKKPLPRFPSRIGVVTSPTGAAIRDFLHVLHRRHPALRVVIYPVRVQGKGAAAEITAAIEELNNDEGIGKVDVIVVTRGGGSLEDLWEFNEESVARAIAGSAIPVVSAVGHEIDFTIADFAADMRAATPSAAAELLAADAAELSRRCLSLADRIGREALTACERLVSRCDLVASSSLFREPGRRIDQIRQTMDRSESDLGDLVEMRIARLGSQWDAMSSRLAGVRPESRIVLLRHDVESSSGRMNGAMIRIRDRDLARMDRVAAMLSALSPEATLRRGFSITRMADGRVLTSACSVRLGDRLRTRVSDGEIESEVKE